MKVQLWHRHIRDTVVILEEGNTPQPQCSLCDVLLTWRSLNGMYWRIEQYKRGVERKKRRLAAEEEREVTARAFSAYERPLEMMNYFR